MRVVSVVGARPQFVKLGPVNSALIVADIEHFVVHTGQHYDANMSQVFFDGLDLPQPTWNLEVGSASAPVQTAAIMAALEPVLVEARPDWVLVYGDTNSTLAAAVTTAQLRLPLAHIEAGLRSGNRTMPEEMNRIVTDHLSDLLLAPTSAAMENLTREGLSSRSAVTGDVMADLVLSSRMLIESGLGPHVECPAGEFVVCTIHRAANTDDPVRLGMLIQRLQGLHVPVLLIAHPRLRNRASSSGIQLEAGSVRLVEPMPYLELMSLVLSSSGVVTDSGGLQKEACLLGVPCTTLRGETEWAETLESGRNVLDPTGQRLAELAVRPRVAGAWAPYGAGDSSARIVGRLLQQQGP